MYETAYMDVYNQYDMFRQLTPFLYNMRTNTETPYSGNYTIEEIIQYQGQEGWELKHICTIEEMSWKKYRCIFQREKCPNPLYYYVADTLWNTHYDYKAYGEASDLPYFVENVELVDLSSWQPTLYVKKLEELRHISDAELQKSLEIHTPRVIIIEGYRLLRDGNHRIYEIMQRGIERLDLPVWELQKG